MKGTSGMLGSVELVVTPEQMYAAASLIEKNVASSQTSFDEMLSLMRSTSAYWEGDAAEKERNRFDKESDNFAAMISNLLNYVSELKTITGIYEVSEQASTTEAMSLQSDVLS